MTNSKNLFVPDAVFVLDQENQDQVLKKVYDSCLNWGM